MLGQTLSTVAFLRTDRLGETLLTLPAIDALQRARPGARIVLVVRPALRDLMARCPGVDVLTYDSGPRIGWVGRALALAGRLRRLRAGAALVANPMKELHLAVWAAGIPRRVGYGRKWGFLLTDRVPDRKALGERHEVEYNLDLIRVLGVRVEQPRWPSLVFPAEDAAVQQLLSSQGVDASEDVVAVHPGTSNPKKRWSPERFRDVIAFVRGRRARVVLIGGPEEQPEASTLAPAAEGVIDLCGRLSLTELAALLRRARVLVSVDSGPVHLAAAVGTRTVVLFGTTEPAAGPQRWGPWGSGHTVIWRPAMSEIRAEDVCEALAQHVGSNPGGSGAAARASTHPHH